MTIKLTKNEAKVLGAFNTYDDVEGTISDLGVSWTDAAELVTETGIKMSSIKGIIGSLVKKGLVDADEGDAGKPDALCLTEAGARRFFELCEEESDAQEAPHEEEAEDEQPEVAYDHTDTFASMFQQYGGHQPRGLCKALLQVAMEWKGTRKQYLEGAAASGLKVNTAGAWWQVARKGGH